MQFLHLFPLAFKILEFIAALNPIYQDSYFLYLDFLPLLCHGFQSSPSPGHLLESTKNNSVGEGSASWNFCANQLIEGRLNEGYV